MFVRFLASFVLISITATFNVYAEKHDNGIKYKFLELRIVDVKGGDGIEIGGSYRLNGQFYAVASFQDLDVGPNNVDFLEFGGGFIIPQEKFDLAAEVTLIDADFGNNSENGFSLSAGGRGYLTPELEVRVFLKHVDVANSDSFVEFGGDYFLDDNLSIGLTLEVASDADTLTFGGRYYF